jgi:hypothetical protein
MPINSIVSTWLVVGAIVVLAPVSRTAHAAEPAHDRAQGAALDSSEGRTALVGSWMGTSGDGLILLSTFNADGTMTNSIQGEVSTNPELGVLTPLHGVWKYLGGRRFGVTGISAQYDINTGAYLGMLKVRIVLTVNKAADQMSGIDKVEIVTRDGTIIALGSHDTPYARIKFEPFD